MERKRPDAICKSRMRPRQLPKFHSDDKFKGTAKLVTESWKIDFTDESDRIFLIDSISLLLLPSCFFLLKFAFFHYPSALLFLFFIFTSQLSLSSLFSSSSNSSSKSFFPIFCSPLSLLSFLLGFVPPSLTFPILAVAFSAFDLSFFSFVLYFPIIQSVISYVLFRAVMARFSGAAPFFIKYT